MKLYAVISWEVVKVCSPMAGFMAWINLTQVRDLVAIIGGVVAMVCTILVTRSTLKKNSFK